jgi:HEAT repeat protein
MLPKRLIELEAELKSPDPEVWQAAFRKLAEVRHGHALSLLHKESSDIAIERAGLARESFQISVCQQPDVALRHTSYEIREASLIAIGQRREVRAIAEVARVLRNESTEAMRELAAKTLAEIGQEACVEGLQHARTDQSQRIRTVALDSLMDLRFPAAERAIVEYLDDEDWELRTTAFRHLSNNGWEPASNRHRVLNAIMHGRIDEAIRHGDDSIQPLINAALCFGNPEVRHWSATTLAKIRSQRVYDGLKEGLKSPHPDVRKAAEEALKIVGTPPPPKPEAQLQPKKKLVRRKPQRPFEEACELLGAALEL